MYMFAHLTIDNLHYASKNPTSQQGTVHITNGANGAFCGVDARRNGYRVSLVDRKERCMNSDRVCERCLAHLRDFYPTNVTYPRAAQFKLATMVSTRLANALAELCEKNGWTIESSEHVMGTDRTEVWISDGVSKTKVEI